MIDHDIASMYAYSMPSVITSLPPSKPIGEIFIGTLGDFCVRVNWHEQEMQEWCIKTYGKDHTRWVNIDRTFVFHNEEDRNWFILRWSS
jgi:hypothetical protein